jgi:hypothetical protein
LLDEDFVPRLRKTIAILDPIDKLITKYQDDKVPLSEIEPDFGWLISHYDTLLAERVITTQEHVQLKDNVLMRKKFVSSKAHRLANLLDPRHIGLAYDVKEKEELEIALLPLSAKNPESVPTNKGATLSGADRVSSTSYQ